MTEEEQLETMREAIALLGKVYQSLAPAPALFFARGSEIKKSKLYRTALKNHRSRARSQGS